MVGIDLVKIKRINDLIKKKNFFSKVFTDREIKFLETKNMSSASVAGLWAAKEAVAKLVKTGFGASLGFQDIEIYHNDGAPYVNLSKVKLKSLLIDKNIEDIDISISHDGDYAIAIAIGLKDKNISKLALQNAKDLLEELENEWNKQGYSQFRRC